MSGRAAPPDGWGIVPAYEDAFGSWREVPDTTRTALIEAMGGDPSLPGPPDTETTLVMRTGQGRTVDGAIEVVTEHGRRLPADGAVPGDLPTGYHELRVRGEPEPRALIVSPGRCHLPADLRVWGWAVQSHALRSRDSWGIGDLADLGRLGRWSAAQGAGTMLVSPQYAVTPGAPRETSPYFPTSRRFRDPLYLRIEGVPGARALGDELDELADRGRALTSDRYIDRDAVAAIKDEALTRIWAAQPDAGREPAFLDLLEGSGASLRRFATFCTLAEVHGRDWHAWPVGYRDPARSEVARFAAEHDDRVRFHCWLQWLVDEQLRAAGSHLALLGDLPIGSDPDGFDAWEWQGLLADGVRVGAPPDELGPEGQDWALPALVPARLRAAGYRPFVDTLRAGFRHHEGLRIDHVLGLFRMFWIPAGAGPAEGAYVRQPARELLDVLALESQRAGALVVGEDLGTVEGGVREELARRHVLRYQVWWFEQDPVERWEPRALASLTTHDLPTLAGVWTGADERMQRSIGREPDQDWLHRQRARVAEATRLPVDAPVGEVSVALHRELAGAPNQVVVAQLEDALGVEERPNVPGTTGTQRPNWSRALPVLLGDLDDTLAVDVARAMSQLR